MEGQPDDSRLDVQRGRDNTLNQLGLTIGASIATFPLPRGAEIFGIYRDGKHIGDVLGDPPYVMSDQEFFSKVLSILEFNKKFTLTLGDGVSEVLRSTDVAISVDSKLSLRLEDGSYAIIDLYNNGGNVGVEIVKEDESTLLIRCIEPGGKVIEYPVRQGVMMVSQRREINPSN